MNILLATYWPVPHAGKIWPFMLQLKTQLERRGHEVDLLGAGDNETEHYVYIVNENRKIFYHTLTELLDFDLQPRSPVRDGTFMIQHAERARKLYELSVAYLGLDKYDLIHTQDFVSTSCMQRVHPNKPVVATFHSSVAQEIKRHYKTTGNSEEDSLARALYNDLERIGIPPADVTHVPNRWLRTLLTREFGMPRESLRVFQYGYDIAAFMNHKKQAEKIKRSSDKKTILFAGKLNDPNQVCCLLDALVSLKGRRSDWECWIAEDRAVNAHLREKCIAAGLENDIVLLGKKEQVLPVLRQTDIFVLASMTDSHPWSWIESQLSGIPSIICDVGGYHELVRDGKTGLLVPPEDPDALCNQLELLLMDDELRQRMGEKAKKRAQAYWSLDKMVDRMLDAYEEAINKSRGQAHMIAINKDAGIS